jgi:hypothetical protein
MHQGAMDPMLSVSVRTFLPFFIAVDSIDAKSQADGILTAFTAIGECQGAFAH